MRRIGLSAVSQIVLQLLRDGKLITKGKSDEELKKEILAILDSIVKPRKFEIALRIDYSNFLLSEAVSKGVEWLGST
jgi:hypothetical protein